MTLTHLSLYRCTHKVPAPMNNAERHRWLRSMLPPPQANGHGWRHWEAARYAREQYPPSDEEMREAAEFEFGRVCAAS